MSTVVLRGNNLEIESGLFFSIPTQNSNGRCLEYDALECHTTFHDQLGIVCTQGSTKKHVEDMLSLNYKGDCQAHIHGAAPL